MFTYQIKKRIFRLENEESLTFPADSIVDFVFAPLQPFGQELDGGKTCVKAVAASVLFDANTGRHSISSNEPLTPLDVTIDEGIRGITLKGNVLSIRQRVDSLKQLDQLIESIFFTLPIVLNVEFVDAPYIKRVSGKIKNIDFRWELSSVNMAFETTTQDLQEKKFIDSWSRVYPVGEQEKKRIMASLKYLHVACRLIDAGNTPWEFMSEVLLNYCKILEVLFPSEGSASSMDIARRELAKLSYSKDEIEKFFIPAIALRNKVDVAHVDLSIFTREQLDTLHKYSEIAQTKFRDLLKRVLVNCENKTYSVPAYTQSKPRAAAIKTIEKLAESLE